ncbi:hypothetical protein EDB87DRAFT_1690960 [Lactarius vividus]|nr:hypothetical protein EDB87DRAFT_1690960 [Lactarius vividus]
MDLTLLNERPPPFKPSFPASGMLASQLHHAAVRGDPPPLWTFTRVFERPFSSDPKSPVVSSSVNALLPPCKFYSIAEDSTLTLGTNIRSAIPSKALAAAACELTSLHSPACRLPTRVAPLSGSSNSGLGFEEKEKGHLVFVGLVVMFDPLHKGVADAMVLLQSGGVEVAVITDDVEAALSLASRSVLRF